jgi:hypothetical protein
MKIAGFILVIDSYLVRLGMVAVLNRIRGVRVLKEFGADEAFMAYLKNHQVDFIIMGQYEFDRSADLFIANPGLLEKTVLLCGDSEEKSTGDRSRKDRHTVIYLHDNKDVIIRKIQNMLDSPDCRQVVSFCPHSNDPPEEYQQQTGDKICIRAHYLCHCKQHNHPGGGKLLSCKVMCIFA